MIEEEATESIKTESKTMVESLWQEEARWRWCDGCRAMGQET